MPMSPGGLGALSGLGQGLSNLAPMYMQMQARKQNLAQREKELERQRDLQNFQKAISIIELGYKTNSDEIMNKGFAQLDQIEPELTIGQYDLGEKRRDLAKNVVKISTDALELGTDEALSKVQNDIATLFANSGLRKTPEYITQTMGRLQTERTGLQRDEERVTALRKEQFGYLGSGEFETETQRREGLRGPVSPLAGTATPGMLGPPTGQVPGYEPLYTTPEKPEVATTKQVWDKKKGAYVQATQVQINQDPDRYGRTEADVLKQRRAGATTIDLTARAVAKKEALTKFSVEKDPQFISKRIKEFKATREDWGLMQPEAQEDAFRNYVLGALSGLYKDVRFRRNKKTGEIALWGDGKLLKIWPKTNF